jgi:16S rRNA (guanine527-N7)-methyltransferase
VTAPIPPEVARRIFDDQLATAQVYANFLTGPGVERGLIGPAEATRVWDRHLLNSAVLAELIPPDATLADLGSGAGLPGVVLAILLPQAQVRLVEPMARRTLFLSECVAALGLTNVEVIRGRAEELAGVISADVVVSRAVAKLRKLAPLAAGLARPGGEVLAIKGASAEDEIRDAQVVLDQVAAGGAEVVTVGAEILSQPTTVVRFVTSSRMARPAVGGRPGAPRQDTRRRR